MYSSEERDERERERKKSEEAEQQRQRDRTFNTILTAVNLQKSIFANFGAKDFDDEASDNYCSVAKIMAMIFSFVGEMTKGYARDVALSYKGKIDEDSSDALDDILCAIDEATAAGNSYFEDMEKWIRLAKQEMDESRNRAMREYSSKKHVESSLDLIRDPNCRSWECCPTTSYGGPIPKDIKRCPSPTEEEKEELAQCPHATKSSDK